MPSDADLNMLPPLLRMAATSSSNRNKGTTTTTTTAGATKPSLLPPQQRPPTVRIPNRVSSFQTRKEQVDALQKIRCAPRADMMTEDERRKQTLLRRRTSKSRADNEANDSGPPPLPTHTTNKEPAVEPSSSHNNNNNNDATSSKQHSKDILEKKLEKVTKLLDKETPGTKEYKKLARKQEHYKAELEELAGLAEQDVDLVPKEPAREEGWKEQENFEEEEETVEAVPAAVAAPEKHQATTALEEEARMLKERADALRAKRRSITASPPEAESKSSPSYSSPTPSSPVMDERERKRQQAVEEYRRKQALKREEEEQARQKAERAKEFSVLKKKVSKLEGMIADADDSGNDTSKLLKKLDEYITQMQEYDEWEEEQEARRQAEEKARLRQEREDAERRRKEEQEAERRRKAEEEAERRRQDEVLRKRQLEEEEEERRQEQIEREQARRRQEREEEEERLRLQVEREEEEERRRKQREEEEYRIRQQQEQENERIRQERALLEQREQQDREQEAMRMRQEREEEMLLVAEGRGDEEEFAALEVDSEEAQVHAARDEELAKEQAEKERLQAERHQQMEEERAHRREELRQQTQAAEIEAASRAPALAKAEASHEFIDIRNIPEPHSNNTKKLLFEIEAVEQRQNRLEKALKQHGVAVSEDIPFDVAKDKIAELQEQMKLAMSDQKKYYALEEEMSKYVTAMMLTDEFAEEQRIAEAKWEYSIEADNIAALRKVRSHVPVNIRNMTEEELTSNPTPNGKILPKPMALKFKRTNVLQLIRVNPIDLERMHPSLIEGLRSTGLTLTERRALHEHLKDVGAKWQELQQDPSIERKYSWFMGLKSKFKEMVTAYDKHVEEFGPPGNHPYAKRNDPPGSGCTLLGNQCPVKADYALSYEEDYGYPQEAEFECGMPAPTKFAAKSKRPSFSFGTKKRDDALMASIRERIRLTDEESAVDSKLLRELFFAEKRVISLEKQLAQNGIALPKEDIPFAVAKAKAAEITEEIKVVASKMRETTDLKESMALEKEYAQLSDDLEKYNNALMLTKEWAHELLETERKWEERVRLANQEALRKIRRHMPVNIKDLSEQDMMQGFTPNGKQLPQKTVRKFMRTNILQLVRMPPSMIEPMHPSSLESMRSTGLTLTERRALHEHLKDLGARWKASSSDKMAERKWMWHESLRGKFKELVDKYDQHTEQYGPAENHPYAKGGESGGCPLIGKQCPVKADQEEDYSQDYGFPPEDVYNVEKVKKSNLLTVEELERRKNDDGWGYDAPVAVEDEPTRAPTAGLMAAISAGGGVAKEESVSQSPMAGGLMAAIAAKGGDDKPKAPGGLLAAIQSRGDDNPKAPGGLLAAIQSRGDDKPKAPGGLLAAIQSRGDDNPKAPRGLFAAITGRGKK